MTTVRMGPGYDLTTLKRVQSLSNRELLARAVVIVGGTAGVVLGAHLWPVLFWTASYFVCSILFVLVLRRLPDRVGPRGLVIAAAGEAIVTLHWPVLFIYLWGQAAPAGQIIAMLILAAIMTNAMGTRSEDQLLRWSDLLSVSVLLALTVAMPAAGGGGWIQSTTVGTVCALLMIWTVVSQREVSATRQRLNRAERDLLERQRIEALGRLTGGVAHDFNNILTVIGGNLDLADAVADPAERRVLLAEARRATERAAGVTAQLLAYSRQSVLAPAEVDVAQVLMRVETFLSRLLPRQHTLVIVPEHPLPLVRVDQTRFESALINLVLNARDAMPEGGRIVISASTCNLSAPDMPSDLQSGIYLCLSVRDEGTGIDPAILPKVVEPYFTTKGVGQGSGLGLSMAKGFAEQSGGGLSISSTPGQGTEVRLLFPPAPPFAGAVNRQ